MRFLLSLILLVAFAAIAFAAPPAPPAKPRTQAIVYVADDCPPCHKMQRECVADLPPAGWRIADRADDTAHILFLDYSAGPRIRVTHILFLDYSAGPRIRVTPTTLIVRDGREVARKVGYLSPKDLAALYMEHAQAKTPAKKLTGDPRIDGGLWVRQCSGPKGREVCRNVWVPLAELPEWARRPVMQVQE
jgi:thiol-disulfide isomerase/thioredoxin